MAKVPQSAERDGLALALVAAWAFLALYLFLYFASPLSGIADPKLLDAPRSMLWRALLFLDQIVGDWMTSVTVGSLVQRAKILAVVAAILGVALATGTLALGATGLARRLTRLEWHVLAMAVGLNLISLATLALGLAGVLNAPSFFAFAIALLLASLMRRQCHAGFLPEFSAAPIDPAIEKPSKVVFVFLVVVYFASAMLPPADFDVREYHLQAPKEFYQNGRLTFLPHNVYANMPLGTEMLALAGMVVTGSWWMGALVGKTLFACFAPLTALALYAAGLRLGQRLAGIVAALVYLSIPWIAIVSTQGLNDAALGCYLFLAFSAIVLWRHERQSGGEANGFLMLAGFLSGAAAACKYSGLLYSVVPLAFAIAAVTWKSNGLRPLFVPLAIFFVSVAAGCGLWFAKNAVLTGNPVYPLLYRVFDGSTRTPEKDAQWTRAHQPGSYSADELAKGVINVTLRSNWQSPLVWPLAALSLLLWRRQPLVKRLVAYVLFLFAVWWLLTHRIDRFWLPMLPLVSLLAGLGATWSTSKAWKTSLVAILAVGLLFNFLVITSGQLMDNRYLANMARLWADPLRVDPWHLYLNDHPEEVCGILLVGGAEPFDLIQRAAYNTAFDDSVWEQIARGRTPEEIRYELARRNISHILVAWPEIERYRSPGNYGMTDFVQPALFEELVARGVLQEIERDPDTPNTGQLFRAMIR